jgi:hypothetical protein
MSEQYQQLYQKHRLAIDDLISGSITSPQQNQDQKQHNNSELADKSNTKTTNVKSQTLFFDDFKNLDSKEKIAFLNFCLKENINSNNQSKDELRNTSSTQEELALKLKKQIDEYDESFIAQKRRIAGQFQDFNQKEIKEDKEFDNADNLINKKYLRKIFKRISKYHELKIRESKNNELEETKEVKKIITPKNSQNKNSHETDDIVKESKISKSNQLKQDLEPKSSPNPIAQKLSNNQVLKGELLQEQTKSIIDNNSLGQKPVLADSNQSSNLSITKSAISTESLAIELQDIAISLLPDKKHPKTLQTTSQSQQILKLSDIDFSITETLPSEKKSQEISPNNNQLAIGSIAQKKNSQNSSTPSIIDLSDIALSLKQKPELDQQILANKGAQEKNPNTSKKDHSR